MTLISNDTASPLDAGQADAVLETPDDAIAEIWKWEIFAELIDAIGEEAAVAIGRRFHTDISRRFAACDDREQVRRDAHIVASAAGMLGFDRLSRMSRALEAVCQNGLDIASSLADLLSARHDAISALAKVVAL